MNREELYNAIDNCKTFDDYKEWLSGIVDKVMELVDFIDYPENKPVEIIENHRIGDNAYLVVKKAHKNGYYLEINNFQDGHFSWDDQRVVAFKKLELPERFKK